MSARSSAPRLTAAAPLLVAGAAAVVFWRTAYPTITWWDSSNYSLAAATLGVGSPPGSLLLTLLGWPVARLAPGAATAHALNLLAGALAAVAAGLVYLVARRVLRLVGETDTPAAAIGAALGALTLAFGATMWEHAVKFTPYVLTAVFTGLVLLTMLRWWEDAERPDAWRWLLLLAFLFGVDFSVHRTNALLIPGALAWVLVRHPRALALPRSWLAGAGGLAAGLAVQLLIIPISLGTRSPLNMFEPTSWPRFWDYVSLAHLGGGFLVDLWPRKAPFWSVQVADFVRVLGDNFFHWSTPVSILGWLPAPAAVTGLVLLWRRDRRLASALALVIALHAAMTVLYFNIPADYFRPLDRHYLPVCVTIAVPLAYGLGAVARRCALSAASRGWRAAAVGAAALALVPAAQLVGNWGAQDASRRYFTRDYAANALESLPPRAIYFTVGDNDTFPVMYLQAVEGVRPDVRIVNLGLANTDWYVNQLRRRDPTFPAAAASQAAMDAGAARWRDTTLVVSVAGTAAQADLPPGTPSPDAVTLRPKPLGGAQAVPSDVVLVEIVRTNAWRDPLTVSITAGGLGWLQPLAHLEGLHWRVAPGVDSLAERERLRANLLGRYRYRGYADPSVVIDDATRTMAYQYVYAFDALLQADAARGDAGRCRAAAARLRAALPPERMRLPEPMRSDVAARCGS